MNPARPRSKYHAWLSCLLLACLLTPAHGAETVAERPSYSGGGEKACLDCHDTESVTGILHGPHFIAADPRSPAADAACESCHGPSEEHSQFPLEISSMRFDSRSMIGIEQESAACLTCHQGDHVNWDSSTHAAEDVGCGSCHDVHAPTDAVLDPLRQTAVCDTCHLKEKIQVNKPYRHPVREGMVVCSDCHDPHGSNGPAELVMATVNETCFLCHAEKRGPFVNEHEPVVDNCLNCHTPHGSNHEALLSVRPPFLCQQCHADHPHSLEAMDPEELPGGSGRRQSRTIGVACSNCHSEVHGSNRPGARSFRQ